MDAQVTLSSAYRGRRRYAEAVLYHNLHSAYEAAFRFEYHILDFNCHQGTGEWVARFDHPEVSVWKNYDAPFWHMTVAQNTILAQARTKWIVMVMGDNFLLPEFFEFLKTLQDGKVYTVTQDGDPGSWGTIAMEREHFNAIGGYDEEIDGWGHDDVNLVKRAQMYGLTRGYWPRHSITAIPHSDDERFGLQQHPMTMDQAFSKNHRFMYPTSYLVNAAGRRQIPITKLK